MTVAWSTWVPCNLCGSTDLAVLFAAARSGRQVVRCRHCRLVFYDPQPAPGDLGALYGDDYYASEYPPEQEAEQRALAHRRLARIETLTRIGTLLDVGCGKGIFVEVAAQRGWSVLGLDLSVAAVGLARSRGLTALDGDLARPRPPAVPAVDVVTMWDVFEHLADPVGDLRRVHGWLRPGGLLVVQTQNAGGVTFAAVRRRWEQFVDAHLFHFSSRTLRRALEQTGFRDVRIHGSEAFVGAVPAPPSGLAARLRRLKAAAFVAAGCDPFDVMVVCARSEVRP